VKLYNGGRGREFQVVGATTAKLRELKYVRTHGKVISNNRTLTERPLLNMRRKFGAKFFRRYRVTVRCYEERGYATVCRLSVRL